MFRALVCGWRLVSFDMPNSALGELIRLRVLKLLNSLRRRCEWTYLFVTHDPSVVRNDADPVAECRADQQPQYLPTVRILDELEHEHMRQFIGAVLLVSEVALALARKLSRSNE